MCDGVAEGIPITSPTEAADFFERKRTLDMSKTKQGVTGLRYIECVLCIWEYRMCSLTLRESRGSVYSVVE
jgi:hypothetical protein